MDYNEGWPSYQVLSSCLSNQIPSEFLGKKTLVMHARQWYTVSHIQWFWLDSGSLTLILLLLKLWKIVNRDWKHSICLWNTNLHLFSSTEVFCDDPKQYLDVIVIYIKDIIIAYLPQKKMQMLRSSTAISWYLKKEKICYIYLYRSHLF